MYNLKSNRFQSGPFPASPAFTSPSRWLSGAEDDPDRGAGHCPICGSFLSGAYYRVDGYAACAVCAIQARARVTRKVAFIQTLILAAGAALACVALPFLGGQKPLQGVIGIFVLFAGVRIAWQLSAGRRLNLDGPYKVSLQK
jgi:hypothetical protein